MIKKGLGDQPNPRWFKWRSLCSGFWGQPKSHWFKWRSLFLGFWGQPNSHWFEWRSLFSCPAPFPSITYCFLCCPAHIIVSKIRQQPLTLTFRKAAGTLPEGLWKDDVMMLMNVCLMFGAIPLDRMEDRQMIEYSIHITCNTVYMTRWDRWTGFKGDHDNHQQLQYATL